MVSGLVLAYRQIPAGKDCTFIIMVMLLLTGMQESVRTAKLYPGS